MLCVENLHAEVNMYVMLCSAVQKQVTGQGEWLRQRHCSPCCKTLDHQSDSETVSLR